MFAHHPIATTVATLAMMAGFTFAAAPAEAGHNSCSTRGRSHVSRSGFGIHIDFGRRHVSHHRGHAGYHQTHARVHYHTTPGRYETYRERVCVSHGHYTTRYIPPVYCTRYDRCGRPYRVMTKPGCYQKVWVPARYEYVTKKRYIPGSRVACSKSHCDY